MQINELYFAGNIGGEVKINTTAAGKTAASFSVCNSEKLKDGREFTTWLQVSCFGDYLIGRCSKLKKGDNVLVHGSIKTNKYTDKEGVERISTFILAKNLMIDPKQPKAEQTQIESSGFPQFQSSQLNNSSLAGAVDYNDIPF